MRTFRGRAALLGASLTAVWLWGGLLLGFLGASALHAMLEAAFPGFTLSWPAILAFVTVIVTASAMWGSRMGRLASSPETGRVRWAGAVGFPTAVLALGFALGIVESQLPALPAVSSGRLPVHRIFTLLFVPTAFLIVAAAALTLAVGLRRPREAIGLAWRAGLASAGGFLVANLMMEALGWQVGGPGAAERYTMVTVTSVGALASAVASGAVLGHRLAPATYPNGSANSKTVAAAPEDLAGRG